MKLIEMIKGDLYAFCILQKGKRWVYLGKIVDITPKEIFLEDTRLREFDKLYKGLTNAPKIGFQVLNYNNLEGVSKY
ncbi:unnamed protein product [marine sediment metagenome]|uniref:Uncharacterized protein n=1 Tax=marine sediment metagenome TaxID=412755 RepID=X0VSL6_9ZZZZ